MADYHSLSEFLPEKPAQEEKSKVSFQDAFSILIAAALVGDFNSNIDHINVMDIIYDQ
jgi:hypothetical protein